MQLQSVADSVSIRVVIADAQSSFRDVIRRQLEQDPQVQVVGEAGDGQTASALISRLKPDILLIEFALNRELSLEASALRQTTAVVVLVAAAEIQDIVEAFERGAKGVVLKASLPQDWGAPIQTVLAGHYWVENESVAVLLQAAREFLVRPEAKSLPDFGLTLREMEIAGKIVSGRSNKEVGREFSICERTVKHHLTNIFKKVGVSTRLELAVLVRDKIASRSFLSDRLQLQRIKGKSEDTLEGRRLYLVTER